jgi:hypothetical protein
MQRVFTRYSVCRWSLQIWNMRGYIVHTNAVAAVQPNVAPNKMFLRCDLRCVIACKYSLNALKKSYCYVSIVETFGTIVHWVVGNAAVPGLSNWNFRY